jgi:hypothetical protein
VLSVRGLAGLAAAGAAAWLTRWCIAIVGAESTGKTARWRARWPNAWLDHTGPALHLGARVPARLVRRDRPHAAGGTSRPASPSSTAHRRRGRHDVVVCDTTALMTAVYSHTVFGDDSLDASPCLCKQHRTLVSLTLLTALDLPWVADGLQRDGPQVREPVDTPRCASC